MKPWEISRLFGGRQAAQVSARWNPDDKDTSISLSNGNRTASKTSGVDKGLRVFSAKSSGKWCLPIRIDLASSSSIDIGLATASASLLSYLGSSVDGWGYDAGNGRIYHNGANSAYGATYATGDVIEILYDASSGHLRFTKNGVLQSGGAAAASGLVGPLFASASMASAALTIQPMISEYAAVNNYMPWD